MLDQYAFIEGLAIERAGPGDLEGIEEMLIRLDPEIEKALAAYQNASERYSVLMQTVPELNAKVVEADADRDQEHNTGLSEVIDCPACAAGEIAMRWLPLERKAQILRAALNRLQYVILPAAGIDKLTKSRDLLRKQAVDAALHAARKHAQDQLKLERSGFLDGDRVVFVSEATTLLRSAAKEAHRVAQVAEADLASELARQLRAEQVALAQGTIGRAQVASAIS